MSKTKLFIAGIAVTILIYCIILLVMRMYNDVQSRKLDRIKLEQLISERDSLELQQQIDSLKIILK